MEEKICLFIETVDPYFRDFVGQMTAVSAEL